MKRNRNDKNWPSPILILLLGWLPCIFWGQSQDRDSWQQPERVLDVIGVKTGMKVGDVGAGEGYFTFKLAERVGESGHVYANEINWRGLQAIKKTAESKGLTNITTILGKAHDPMFPPRELDLALMVHVIHYLEKPVEYFQNLKTAIKVGGHLALVQWDRVKLGAPRGTENLPEREDIIKTVEEAGFELVKEEVFLEKDNIFLFRALERQVGRPDLF